MTDDNKESPRAFRTVSHDSSRIGQEVPSPIFIQSREDFLLLGDILHTTHEIGITLAANKKGVFFILESPSFENRSLAISIGFLEALDIVCDCEHLRRISVEAHRKLDEYQALSQPRTTEPLQ